MKISLKELKRIIEYNRSTGLFHWRVRVSKKCGPGRQAGGKIKFGYVAIGINGRRYNAHHLAWMYVHGRWPNPQIDHIDGNPANNKIANLRESTQQQNLQNQHGPHRDNKWGIQGVRFRKGKWEPRIKAHGRQINLGRFDTAKEASDEYIKAKKKYGHYFHG